MDDERNSQEKQMYSDGTYYEGGWKDGYPDGYGSMKLSSGEVLDGEWSVNENGIVVTKAVG